MDVKKESINKLIQILSDESKPKETSEELSTNLSPHNASALATEYLRAEIDKLKEEVESLKQNRRQRKIFGFVIFGFMALYMATVLVLVYLKGFGIADLSDAVIITLVTTSLASVIGIFNFVVKYLFHPGKGF